MGRQLPLGVALRDDATLDNFLFLEEVSRLKHLLEQLAKGLGDPLVFLCGAPGSGRSHLLEAACHEAPAGSAQYIPLRQLSALSAADVLAGLEQMQLLCLDDIDAIAGKQEWEEALFHLYNRCQQTGCRWLCSAQSSPAQLDLGLADLRSRLSAGLVLALPRPGDEEKQQILQFRASRRGMALADDVAQFILARAGRSPADLLETLDRLDRESLVAGRALTIPFVKQILGW